MVLIENKFITMKKRLFLISFLLLSISSVFAQGVSVSKGEFFRKNLLGLEKCTEYMAGDSTFYLSLTLNNPDTFHKVTAVWYLKSTDNAHVFRLDSSEFGIKSITSNFTISYTRAAYGWLSALYFVKIYIDGEYHKTFHFEVYPEEIIDAQFMTVSNNKLEPSSQVLSDNQFVNIRIFFDKEIIDDGSEILVVWFFELPSDDPIYIHEDKYEVEGKVNYIDFGYLSKSEWPEGYIVVEVWLNNQFKKFFRIQVKEE
jgi:hypothetical protein